MKNLVYLACPYSHPDPMVRADRFDKVTRVAAELMKKGLYIFSPITHTHPMAVTGELPGDWEFWEGFDRAYLDHCHKLIVLKLPGWETSKGVAAERKIAGELGLEVEYLDP